MIIIFKFIFKNLRFFSQSYQKNIPHIIINTYNLEFFFTKNFVASAPTKPKDPVIITTSFINIFQ